ncbi:hypothetical protein YPPY66_2494 [Yersinia pestis PY-66]|uniref:Uncharacterized protein n=1 Tax=Yersinia pestis PY-08 TaxID=992134 RepID=A0AB72ZQ16_YERPE|nr:hypothetical protein YpF1991016_3885 [Yersinia pestis biovar Orientalis str. F1991016]EIQ88862.1 hypothetical protein YPPY01_2217 [Yersinia pestis PY-01]EIQ90338.1 hypothetical protein YPPY02_2249 [Yersinia pestis PY-02]EIQ98889.1 hypothetical protein YPPY03_0069 [Yersinia pestis PY-03]EIR02579.1 hypothetical protein YPPY04_2266 [Yersinia pestis PY-04]EIR04183.1 hypothetical protein YPPY05_2247 [Yersinia pestis PY-05]EIR06906.1 hypothetical protein YPPY06_2311 [Yersinia pestis PY-06]EIR18
MPHVERVNLIGRYNVVAQLNTFYTQIMASQLQPFNCIHGAAS